MANIQNTTSVNLLDAVLPTFGNQIRINNPRWHEDMKMFVMSEYESKAGHRYIRGIRFSDQVAVIIDYSLWNSWTYLNSIEVYRFNGNEREMIGRKEFDKVFYSDSLVHSEVKSMLEQAIISMARMNGTVFTTDYIESESLKLVIATERSFNKGEYPPITGAVRKLIEGTHNVSEKYQYID